MKEYLNEIIDRQNTASVKWDPIFLKQEFTRGDILPLWVADMDFKCPQPILDAIIERAQHGILGYTFRDDNYTEAIINWNQRRHNWAIEKEWILFTPGVVCALNNIVQAFCKPGDKIIIQNPVYYPFTHAIVNNGCQTVTNELKLVDGRYEMDFEHLEKVTKDPYVKLMILCNPHNPVGRVWTKDELIRLAEICIKNEVTIIADEIHGDLVLNGHKHIPLAGITEEIANNTITCTAPSKTFNIAGLQASNVIVSNERLRTLLSQQLVRNAVEMTNVFGIVGLTAAYNECEDWLDDVLAYLESNVEFIDKYVKENMPRVKFIKPEGTYLGWLDFRDITEDKKVLDDILINKAKIALDGGYWFGAGGDGFARINYACPRQILKDALDRICRAIEE